MLKTRRLLATAFRHVAMLAILNYATPTMAAEKLLLPSLSVVPNEPDQAGIGPGGIVMLDAANLATLDVVRQRLLRVAVDGGHTDEIPLPKIAGQATSLKVENGLLALLSRQGEILAEVDTVAVAAGGKIAWQIPPRDLPAGTYLVRRQPPSFKVERSSDGTLFTSGRGAAGRDWRVGLPSLLGGKAASVNGVQTLADGAILLWWEELSEPRPTAWVGRFTPEGRLSRLVRVPTELAEQLPARYVALAPDGRAYFQGAAGKQAFLLPLELTSPEDAVLHRPAPPVVTPQDEQQSDDELEQAFREQSAQENGALPPQSLDGYPPRPRGDVLAEAYRYLSMTWVLGERNYAHPNIPSECDVGAGKYWQRPKQLEGRQGQEITAMPYQWGGDNSPEQFRKRIAKGALAGDICSCRDPHRRFCITRIATGVDCSGYVSNAWGIPHHTTDALFRVSTPLPSLEALEPGDALVWRQHHARLYIGRSSGTDIRFKMLESSVSCGGVCETTYSAVELADYTPIRYRKIVP
ncbi:hypothetical protein FNU76_20860 [Chitinimonas arctica]|uniref:NlpC/P60 domain-containing protein n=1 Tax=Chitinimonas arctica TaxID=2594795 RepID=A0A516SKD0_9NEIS|nr:hypothetical protein [Chitinimonas arctica]QDQ28604.1 hypothetical protein FNU76_20860 [Chitinimonas arctica]